jgi:DNA repair exonuclease SbcCD ATPase subunit
MPFVESPRVLSPDPLPHPYRSKDSKPFAPRENDSSDFTDTSDTLEPAPARDEDAPLEDCVTRPPLIHRRSSLKKSSSSIRASMDATKNVAWAMDQDWQEQVQKYDAAAFDAEAADREWEAARATYEEELGGLKALRQNLSRTLAKLRTETEKLQREDEVIKDQEIKLRESYKQLEQTQDRYRGKVQAVVDETKSVLSLCNSKRSGQFGPP